MFTRRECYWGMPGCGTHDELLLICLSCLLLHGHTSSPARRTDRMQGHAAREEGTPLGGHEMVSFLLSEQGNQGFTPREYRCPSELRHPVPARVKHNRERPINSAVAPARRPQGAPAPKSPDKCPSRSTGRSRNDLRADSSQRWPAPRWPESIA